MKSIETLFLYILRAKNWDIYMTREIHQARGHEDSNTILSLQFPLWHSGLKIWCCHSCNLGHRCRAQILSLTQELHVLEAAKKKKKMPGTLKVLFVCLREDKKRALCDSV